jgi:hypothetical protein
MGKNRGEERCEVDSASLLAQFGQRVEAPKRNAIVLCFLQAARAETTDAVIEMQDKLITGVHNKARLRYDDLLRATEEARSRAVEVLEELGTIVLDESIPDSEFRGEIFAKTGL